MDEQLKALKIKLLEKEMEELTNLVDSYRPSFMRAGWEHRMHRFNRIMGLIHQMQGLLKEVSLEAHSG